MHEEERNHNKTAKYVSIMQLLYRQQSRDSNENIIHHPSIDKNLPFIFSFKLLRCFFAHSSNLNVKQDLDLALPVCVVRLKHTKHVRKALVK